MKQFHDQPAAALFSDYLFWDVRKERLDLIHNKNFIIRRVFERGTLPDLVEVLFRYDQEDIIQALTQAESLDQNALDLSGLLFHLSDTDFRCYTSGRSRPVS